MENDSILHSAGAACQQQACSALVAMLADPEARNQIDTAEKAQEIIDDFEEHCDHGEMPEAYNWAVSRRNRLRGDKQNRLHLVKVKGDVQHHSDDKAFESTP